MGGDLARLAAASEDEARRFRRLRRANRPALMDMLAGDQHEAAVFVASAARSGVIEAQLRLGRMLLAGEGVAKDPGAALGWFRTAARSGDADAMNMIGRCSENGWGRTPDYAEAARYYRAAASRGHLWAAYNLGHCYLDGIGMFPDRVQAYRWYRRAALGGHPRAMNLLGRCLEHGWGIATDARAAGVWYEHSARSGYFRGQFNYATLLLSAGDVPGALHWFKQAAEGGTAGVRQAIANLLTGHTDLRLRAFADGLSAGARHL